MLFCLDSARFSEIQFMCDDGRTDGRANPLIEIVSRKGWCGKGDNDEEVGEERAEVI